MCIAQRGLHAFWRRDTEEAQALPQHHGRRRHQAEAGIPNKAVIDQDTMGVIEAMEVGSKIPQIKSQQVWGKLVSSLGEDLGKLREPHAKRLLLRLLEGLQGG